MNKPTLRTSLAFVLLPIVILGNISCRQKCSSPSLSVIGFAHHDTSLNNKVAIKRYKAGTNYAVYVDSEIFKPFYLFYDTMLLEAQLSYDFDPKFDYVISLYPITRSFFIKDIKMGTETIPYSIGRIGCVLSCSFRLNDSVYFNPCLNNEDHELLYVPLNY